MAVPHVAEQERGLIRRPFLGAGLHLPDSVVAFVLCKVLGTQIESQKVAHIILLIGFARPVIDCVGATKNALAAQGAGEDLVGIGILGQIVRQDIAQGQ